MLLKVLFLVLCCRIVASVRDKRQGEPSTTTNTPPASSSTGDAGGPSFESSGQKELVADSNGKFVIKVGHIGAIGALPNDDKIIEISRRQLVEEGILGKDFDFELVFQNKFLLGYNFQDHFEEWLWRCL